MSGDIKTTKPRIVIVRPAAPPPQAAPPVPVATAAPVSLLDPYVAPQPAPPQPYLAPSAMTPRELQLEGKQRVPSLLETRPGPTREQLTPGTLAHVAGVETYQANQGNTQPGPVAQAVGQIATITVGGLAAGNVLRVQQPGIGAQVLSASVSVGIQTLQPYFAAVVQKGYELGSDAFGRGIWPHAPPIFDQEVPVRRPDRAEVKEPAIPPGGPPGGGPGGSNNWLDIKLPDGKTDWRGFLIVAGLIGAGLWAYYSREEIKNAAKNAANSVYTTAKKAGHDFANGAIVGVAGTGAVGVTVKAVNSK